MRRFVCIHGHFYQPPRENPWLEAIEPQPSAYPYHDWNERVDAECYAPNADARILDGAERITRIVDNYRRMSFNFGPTLLAWLAQADRETYAAILAADRASAERFSGHGSALAQAYGHAILPLANARDRRTYVAWGVRDFEQRFARRPEGLWLPETAVDLESLEALAAFDIRFTILAPGQAAAVRRLGEREWTDVSGGRIDTGRPYLVRLPSGREIALYFYHSALSGAVAFGGLLSRGDELVRRLLAAFPADDPEPRLVAVATDGETYGHHHRFGDMALAYALADIEHGSRARLTNLGEYLALHPPTHEVRIVERSAWSCAHGVGRWSHDCGCATGAHPDWKQHWRAPLRDALDWLRDALAPEYAREAAKLLGDPWAARDDYVEVLADRSAQSLQRFFARHATGAGAATPSRALGLLELQRQALMMYASCGWFFDDVSGLEGVQLLRHAGRAAQLAERLFGGSWEQELLLRLERVPSNVTEIGHGRALYEKKVRPVQAGLDKVAANFAAGLLFGEDGAAAELSAGFAIDCRETRHRQRERARLVVGRLHVRSRVTLEDAAFDFAFVHKGEQNLSGAVRATAPDADRLAAQDLVCAAFERGDLAEVLAQLERHYGATRSLDDLFGDNQRRILGHILEATVRDAESVHHELYERHAGLLRYLKELESPAPRPLAAAAEIVLNASIRRGLERAELDLGELGGLFAQAAEAGVALDRPGLGYAARRALEALAARLGASPERSDTVVRLRRAVELVQSQPLDLDLRRVQNGYYRLSQEVYPRIAADARRGDGAAAAWMREFDELGRVLRVARG